MDIYRALFLKHKEHSLSHRYITNHHIESLLDNIRSFVSIDILGSSVLDKPIYGLKLGDGKKRILMWSQMHGNESTTTKALFDLINTLLDKASGLDYILNSCTLYIIPILNPDGAEAYTRVNANAVDLNRDAQDLSQPESKVLLDVFKSFKPDFCYNLHGQRTIFSAGNTNKSATISFLAPAQDENCTITPNRKIAMEVIASMNKTLQRIIPNQVGVYDDAFNLNCVGDTFQHKNVPTILFEAGHYSNDYQREKTRELIYIAYVSSLDYISKTSIKGDLYKPYFEIPENGKLFLDIIIRNSKINNTLTDVGIQFQEKLINKKIEFIPQIVKIETLKDFYGHKEIDAKGLKVLGANDDVLTVGYENDLVLLNNEKISLLVK